MRWMGPGIHSASLLWMEPANWFPGPRPLQVCAYIEGKVESGLSVALQASAVSGCLWEGSEMRVVRESSPRHCSQLLGLWCLGG